MAFRKDEADALLVDTGRRCCICGELHFVSVHHIIPVADGGTDEIDNAIPLCPNCHDAVHSYGPGATHRRYSPEELRLHRQRAIDRAQGRVPDITHEVPYIRPVEWFRYFDGLLSDPDVMRATSIVGYQDLTATGRPRAADPSPIAGLISEWLNDRCSSILNN